MIQAEISDPQKTLDINYKGRARVARLSKESGVKRYILASSCSIYGFRDGLLSEKSPINPLTTYAKANRLAEVSAKKTFQRKIHCYVTSICHGIWLFTKNEI